ncbi:MAG: amino acid ABC transporter permease [Sulfitobacter sp.]|jgi:general L-amino acid transport system permease protein|uniref:amino acid ABC transporter permease n=1 Tax=Sulfitobacter TaxID=60136 RepID=UPI0007C29793|nr:MULTISPECIES: amino acid ABC transporter permease [Sulfitobacter]KZX95180.1 amino acid ABC transporter permease [Sulfitobacter sp. HI0021]KZY00234.1 amino acid ABC transporter permease [Sulfitobacter sp. HI0027]KZZ04098.1 amino acid ABC transporter permease [Sulfitobacter sp. HI0076]MCZ4368016.1 amino acid ABC transporter permease [Sulfitobacter dubius]WPZ29990.1 amino acid ABC transporter permease [Sulfitobacter sp. OXR-159]|tara:strand:+ start:4335 stop:5633 length:1299 start_codon:yes stop_codon:yes gene_type:complete
MSDTHAESIAFVRETSLPPSAPPDKVGGPVKWVKDNLFPTWANALLTVVALYFLYLLLAGSLPWLLNGVWSASSLSECREVLDGATGACFSVLSERWHQLLFGFKYPSDQYWRPTLALVLLFLAVAPVLFIDLPRKLLYFTGVYPFLAFWLIWGGPIWGPIFALLGVIAGYIVYSRLVQKSFAMALAGGLVAAVIVWYIGGFIGEALRPASPLLQAIPSRDLGGFMLNMMLGITCVSLSLPIGIALALGRQSHLPIVKGICVVFIEFVRGVPLITLLFVANVMLAYFFPPGSGVDLFIRVVIMITMFSSAYIAEVIRGGLAALPKGQYEAADSLGLDYPQAMRLIILPQALKISIPGIVNIAVGLFKDTTLVSVISLFDIIGMIRGPILASTDWNGVYWELFLFASVLFFIVCYGISQYSQWLERRLATDHR